MRMKAGSPFVTHINSFHNTETFLLSTDKTNMRHEWPPMDSDGLPWPQDVPMALWLPIGLSKAIGGFIWLRLVLSVWYLKLGKKWKIKNYVKESIDSKKIFVSCIGKHRKSTIAYFQISIKQMSILLLKWCDKVYWLQ